MRHHNRNKKLGRIRKQRRALLRSLVHSLARDGKIKTTEAKAKTVRPFVERLISLSRKDSLASRRLIGRRLGSEKNAALLIKNTASRFAERKGGYTRIVKAGVRRSDGAKMAVIELT